MAVQITAYELAREYLSKDGQDPKDLKIQFLAGCFSGFSHVAASNPMEVLKVRGQVLGAAGGGLVGAIKDVGLPGLFRGVGACWARDIPFSAIYFPAYSFVKTKLEDQGQPAFVCSMGAGLIAGVLAAGPTTPFDVVKTRMQNPNVASVGLVNTVTQMWVKEGPSSFFVGVRPRVGRVRLLLCVCLCVCVSVCL
jgi:solute carrier family 25 aspartate/glutamate transporter 12/13